MVLFRNGCQEIGNHFFYQSKIDVNNNTILKIIS